MLQGNGRTLKWILITAIATAAFGSGYMTRLLQQGLQPITRPDPFTGQEGAELEDRVNARIDELEGRVEALEGVNR